MKKLILALVVSLVLVFAIGASALAENTFKASYDVSGTLNMGVSQSLDNGFSFAYEYTSEVADNICVGAGIELELTRKFTGYSDGLSCIPIYGLLKYNFDNFYINGKLGYDIFTWTNLVPGLSTNGGLCYGAGFGINIDETNAIEIGYLVLNGTLNTGFGSISGSYSKIGVTWGFKF